MAAMLRFRQWTFPPEFRISVDCQADAAELLVAAVKDALAAAQAAAAPPAPAPAGDRTPPASGTSPVGKPGAAIDADFAASICNDIFRLRRNVQQMAGEGGETKELRSIRRAVENVDALLKGHGIQYFDLTGKDFDERSEDFEPMGQAQEVRGLDRKLIAACERPVVVLNGKLVQRARGVVQKPARGSA
jgi:hypothetical protein